MFFKWFCYAIIHKHFLLFMQRVTCGAWAWFIRGRGPPSLHMLPGFINIQPADDMCCHSPIKMVNSPFHIPPPPSHWEPQLSLFSQRGLYRNFKCTNEVCWTLLVWKNIIETVAQFVDLLVRCVAHIEMSHYHEAHRDIGRISSLEIWHTVNWKSKDRQHVSLFSWRIAGFSVDDKNLQIVMLMIK